MNYHQIPRVGSDEIRHQSNTKDPNVGPQPGFLQEFVGLIEIHTNPDRIPIGSDWIRLSE